MLFLRDYIRPTFERGSAKLTEWSAILCGEQLKFWYVCEYPKSGGTWLSRMIAHYLDLPFPQHSVFPLGAACVVQNHWGYHPRFRRCFYLYRDGRDIMASYYFMRMRGVTASRPTPFHCHMKRVYTKAFGNNFDPEDSIKNMPRFIEVEMTSPRGSRINWPCHIEQWYQPDSPHISCISYEQLLSDPVGAIGTCLSKFLDDQVDEKRVEESVRRFEFSRMTGRKPGIEDRNSAIRKGVAGDWVNHFSKEAGAVFDHFAGQVLIDLKYEPDRSWLSTHSFVS